MKEVDYASGDKRKMNSLRHEIQIFKKLKHPHIVRYYEIREEKYTVYIFMEFTKGGSVRKLILRKGALCQTVASKYCQHILEGLPYLHDKKIVHRDFKCANILLDKFDNAKLCDFVISKENDNVSLRSCCYTESRTLSWMAPEVIERNKYGRKSNILSFGCKVLEILNKVPPYHELKAHCANCAMLKVVSENIVPHFPRDTSDPCKAFTKMCLQKYPECRSSAKDLLKHRFTSIWND